METDAVTVDVKLGSDEESIKQCYAEGYEPVYAICFEMPQLLLSIDQAARDAIYVRLLNRHSNENWNHLFSGDFVAFRNVDQDLEDLEGHPAATGEDEQQTQEFVDLQDDPVSRLDSGRGIR